MADDTTNRLDEIQSELSEILVARLGALEACLRQTEAVTRQIIAAEMEKRPEKLMSIGISGGLIPYLAKATQNKMNTLARHLIMVKKQSVHLMMINLFWILN